MWPVYLQAVGISELCVRPRVTALQVGVGKTTHYCWWGVSPGPPQVSIDALGRNCHSSLEIQVLVWCYHVSGVGLLHYHLVMMEVRLLTRPWQAWLGVGQLVSSVLDWDGKLYCLVLAVFRLPPSLLPFFLARDSKLLLKLLFCL